MTQPDQAIGFPARARVVIIGGGVVGCSTAYHMTRLGWTDVVVLERKKLTSGSTFHAAGLVGQLRSSASITQLLKYSVELYANLEAETGQATGWKAHGGLRLACNRERLTEIKRQATTAHSFGLEMHILSAREAGELWPLMDTSDVVGAAYLPTDGQASPADLCQALAKGARMRGGRILEGCEVIGFDLTKDRVAGVRTSQGSIECEIVVNCGGIWAGKLGRMAGVTVPVQPMQHQYLITEPIDGITANLPTLRDPDRLCYFKEEVGGLAMGGYEHNPKPWIPAGGIPDDFHFQLLDEDWDQFEPLLIQASERVPALGKVGVRKMINGPEAFTPDGSFILGEAPGLKGYFVGAGFNAYGIAANGGAGKALAEWIVTGEPSLDLWPVDIRRFGPPYRDAAVIQSRTREATGKHYAMAWPHAEDESARSLRLSPLYARLQGQGCCFGSKFGWERPNWFAPVGIEPRDQPTFERPNWFQAVGQEHRGAREAVALFDETSFAKFVLQGADAESALSWMCANDVVRPVGAITYTQLCNRRGGIEADLTVCRIAEDKFYLVTGTGFAVRDFDWIARHIPDGARVELTEVTSAFCVLGLMGPRSRDVLSSIVAEDLSNEAFPFATAQELVLAGAVVRALRVTFVGELGWELHIPAESACAVYDLLLQTGKSHGIVNAGYRAIESLRLEKGYRIWGADLSSDYTPLEAGLAWAVKLKTDIPFHGREALEKQRGEPLRKRLAFFTVEDLSVILLGRETIYRNGQRVGWLSSGGFGYSVGMGIGMGYVRHENGVDRDFLTSGAYELEVACQRVPCKMHLRPLYDPTSKRVKA